MPNAVTGRLQWPGMPEHERSPGLLVSNYIVDDGFFRALEIPLVAGRTFDSRDGEQQVRTAVLGRSLADVLGGPHEALNQLVVLNGVDYRVVGVVGNAMFGGPREGPEFRHEMYLSYLQLPRRVVSPVVHVAGDPEEFVQPLKTVLARVAPSSAMDWVEPVDWFLGWLYRDSAFRLALVAAFAVSALLLAAVALYAVLAQQVASSTTEIGIRKAVGATGGSIVAGVLRGGLTVAAWGVVAGCVLSLAFARIVQGLLHGVGLFDPAAFIVSTVVLMTVAAIACLLPALRAARVPPMEALRHD